MGYERTNIQKNKRLPSGGRREVKKTTKERGLKAKSRNKETKVKQTKTKDKGRKKKRVRTTILYR
jgi:hypothetical protein